MERPDITDHMSRKMTPQANSVYEQALVEVNCAPTTTRFAIILSVVFFMAIFTHKGFIFPFDFYIVSGFLGFLVPPSDRWARKGFILLSFFVIMHFAIITVFEIEFADITSQLRSTGLFGLTLVASLGGLYLLLHIGNDRLRGICLFTLIFLIVVAFLEQQNILKAASDEFRLFFYDTDLVYANDIRDITSFGVVRPKAFSSEPSHLAKFLAALGAAVYLLSRGRITVYLTVFLLLIAFLIIRSIAILPGLALIFVGLFFDRNPATRPSPVLKTLIASVFLFFIYYVLVQVADRVGLKNSSTEASAYLRIVHPFLEALSALNERPFFGFGLGADSAIFRLRYEVLVGSDAPVFVLLNPDKLTGGSFFFSIFWQFGVVGSIFILFFIVDIIKKSGRDAFMPITLFLFLLSLTVGDIHTPLSWGYIIIVVAANRLRWQSNA